MQPLRSVLMAFADRPDVAGAVVVSDDGLVVESVLPDQVDADEIAALTATGMRALVGLSAAARAGAPIQTVIEAAQGTLILQRLAPAGFLVALAAPDGDLGALLYDLRRHAPALTTLL